MLHLHHGRPSGERALGLRKLHSSLRSIAALAIVAAAWPDCAHAQSGAWTWAGGTGRSWSTTANWNSGTVASGSGNTATFQSASSGTTVLDTDRTIGNITQNNANTRVIDGPSFTLTLATTAGSTPTLSGTAGSTLSITSTIAGSQGFSKTGASTLNLTGANTFSGTALLQTGTTLISNVAALGASGAGNETVISSGAQLRIATTGTIFESFTVSGRGGNNDGAIQVRNTFTSTINGAITLSGSAEFFPQNGGNLILAGNIGGTGNFISRHGSSSGDTNITGNLANTGWLTKWTGGSGGRLTLSGSNSYTGSTAVDAGPMTLNNASALPATTALSLTGPSATLDLNGFDTTIRTFGWRTDGVNAANQNNSTGGVITDNSTSSGITTITVTSGSFILLTAINDGASRKVALRVAGDNLSNLELQGASSTFSGGLTLLTGSGNGTRLRIDVPVANTVTGGIFAASPFGTGTISLGLSSADKVQLMSGSGSYVGGLGSTILNDIIFNSAQGTDFATAVLLNATETTFAGTLVAGQASITIATGAQVPNSIGVLSGRVTSTGSSGGLVLRDSGQTPGLTVRLANATGTANDYQGTTSIEGNTTLLLGAANQVPNGVGKGDVSVAGSFNLGGFSDTINGLTGSGIVDGISSTPTLTVGDGNATASFSGVLKNTAGTLALVKIGSGVQTLAGTNTYGGSTSVSAGTLLINGDQSAATGAVTVAAGATLGGSGTVGGNTTITGIHSPGNSPGIQTFNGNLTYEAGAVVNWELIANSTGSAGTDYDQILLPTTGNLSFSGSTTLALSFNGAGSAVDWSNAFWNVNRSWMVYDLSSGVVINPGSLVIGGSLLDSVGNSLSPTGRGYFNTSVSGQDVMLNFVAVPEPSTIVLLSGLAVGGFLLRRRRA